MGLEAATKALLDAGRATRLSPEVLLSDMCLGITYDSVEAAHVGHCYGDSTSGQVLVPPREDLRNTELIISGHYITSG